MSDDILSVDRKFIEKTKQLPQMSKLLICGSCFVMEKVRSFCVLLYVSICFSRLSEASETSNAVRSVVTAASVLV